LLKRMHHRTKTVFLLLLLQFVRCEELQMYIDIVGANCHVERLNAQTSTIKSVEADLATETLSSCIGLCKSFEEENGPAYLTDDNTSNHFFIKSCQSKNADAHSTETVKDNIFLPVTLETCEVEYYIGNSVYGFGYLEESDEINNLENCLSLCHMLADENDCTAVEYLEDSRKCRLFKSAIVQHAQTYDGLFAKIIDCHEDTLANVNEPEESENLPESEIFLEEPETTKNGTVALVSLYERCDVTYHATKENFGFKTFKEIKGIKSLSTCLFLCRVEETCKAVLFAPKDKMCQITEKSDPTSKVEKSDNQLFVQIIVCEKDRVQERLHNPLPIKYYLPEMEEVCKIEFYVLPKLTSWLKIGNSVKASNLIECLQACKVLENIQECSAVNFSLDKECVLLKRGKPEDEYTVLHKSLFGEIVDCFEESIVELSLMRKSIFTLLVYVLLFKVELAEKMSIMVQPLGQMCTVERKYFDIHEALNSRLEQWFSPSTETCISMCCARRANIDCQSIIFKKKESTCIFLNSAFHHYMSTPSTATFDSELYVINSCGNGNEEEEEEEEDDEQPGPSTQREEIVHGRSPNTDDTEDNTGIKVEMKIDVMEETCEVIFERRSEVTGYSYFQETESINSLENCLALCRMSNDPACSAVDFSIDKGECTLLTVNPNALPYPRKRNGDTEDLPLYSDLNEETGYDVSEPSSNQAEMNEDDESKIQLEILQEICKVHFAKETETVDSLPSCLTSCRLTDSPSVCAAVEYNPFNGQCQLFAFNLKAEKHTKNQENIIPAPFSFRDDPVTLSSEESLQNYEAEERGEDEEEEEEEEEEAVRTGTLLLYSLLQRCDVRYYNKRNITGFKKKWEKANVRHLTACVTCCRIELQCSAVMFSSTDRVCGFYSTSEDEVVEKNSENAFVEIVDCRLDRLHERYRNPPFMKYFLPTLEELCTIEFYTLTALSEWKTIGLPENATNLINCFEACRVTASSEHCSAVNFLLNGECILLQKATPDDMYDVQPNIAEQFMIYVRPLEKLCTVEKKLIETSLIAESLIEQWSMANLEMCISACIIRRSGIPCQSVVFDSQQDHNCKLLDNSFLQTSSAHHGSSPQSELYIIHSCDRAIQSLDENLVIPTQMQLEITQESCTLFFLRERTATGFSYFHQDFAHTLNNCLALCRMTFEPFECMAVDYNSANNQCVLLKLNPDAFPYARQHGKFQQIGDNTGVEARMNLNVLQESCLVYFLREASVTGYSFFNQETSIDSLKNCITLCRLADAQHDCTAVHFTADSKECTLLRVNPNADPYTRQPQSEFVVIGDCAPKNLSLIKSTVAIYQMLEECNGNYYKDAVIPGFNDVQKIKNINSFPRCLHHCRVEALTETCDAVLFSKEEKKCTLFKRDGDMAANKTAEEIFIELTDCHDDRSEERKYNPAPLKYYFPEEKEICLIEFYVQRTISSWSQINELQNVTSMRTCMEECRSKQQSQSEKCAAFNINNDRKCRLFKKDGTAPLYTVMDGGIFGEILLCYPGNMLAFSEKVLIYLNSTDSLSVVERKALNLAQIFYNLTQALPFYLLASDSLRDCIVLCCNEGTCKSVIYSNRESRCLLLQNSFNDHQSKLFRLKNRPQLYAVHTCNQSASAIPDVTRTVQEEELFLLPSYDYLPSSSEEEAANISEYPSESEASEILTEDVQRNETCYVAQSGAESEELTDDSDNHIAERSVAIYQLFEECHVNFLLKGEVVVGYKTEAMNVLKMHHR
ncbi:hypothetical protein T4B_3165, partial [Trichinella pseudospiralis]